MKARRQSRVLGAALRLLMFCIARLLGGRQRQWALAMQAEVAAIDDEREALAFACGCLRAALGDALVRHLGVLGCVVAVLLGCLFMSYAGAPARYAWMNLLSLAFALGSFWLLPRQRLQRDGLLRAQLVFALGALLLAGSWGAAGEAAWLNVGPARLNLVWLLLPSLLVASRVGSDPLARIWALAGLMMAFGALALQADALMAGVAAVFLGLRGCARRSRGQALLALLPLSIALHAAPQWQRPEALPFIDEVLQRGFAQHPAIGLGLAAALILPLWPALLHPRAREHAGLWGLLFALSLPGWLPSPLLGFGGSLMLSFLLSLALMPADAASVSPMGPGRRRAAAGCPHQTESAQHDPSKAMA